MVTLEGFTEAQTEALVITERVNAGLSMLGILFVILTYAFDSGFNKPINRLIFFASFGNLGSIIASLISADGVYAGPNAPLCQTQAFLLQMFLGVDCWWAFFMAVNVYLIFFRGYTTSQLRTRDIWYLVLCYGISFIPAISFIFISTQDQGRIYGNALIWCWITSEWDWVRFVFLYSIAWTTILFAFVVYARAGKVIWDKRRHLDGFLNPLNENPFVNTITTEIEITHEDRPIITEVGSQGHSESGADLEGYSVRIGAEQGQGRKDHHPLPAALRMRSVTRDAAERETNADAWLYARVAFLFFLALLITWVPASVNRLYALVHPKPINFALNYAAAFFFPLQGFWNVIIYIITSQTACRRLWNRWFSSAARRESISHKLTRTRLEERRILAGKQRLQSFSSLT